MSFTKIKTIKDTASFEEALKQLGRLYLYDYGQINDNETTDEWKAERVELDKMTKGKAGRDDYRQVLVEAICAYEENHPSLDEDADVIDYLMSRLETMQVPVKQLHVMGSSPGNINRILNRKADVSKQQIRALYKYFAIPSDVLVKEIRLKEKQ